MNQWQKIAFALSLVFTLPACGHPKEPHSASLERRALMRLAFAADKVAAPKDIHPITVTEVKYSASGSITSVHQEVRRAQIAPVFVVKLDKTHAVMLVTSQFVDENDEVWACHACFVLLGAYFFTHDDQGWKMTHRQDDVTSLGVEGNPGSLAVSRFGANRYVFTAEWGSCWQGYCGSWLNVVGLQADLATDLIGGIPTFAADVGAHEDCDTRLADNPRSSNASAADGKVSNDETDAPHSCFNVTSKWSISGEQLTVSFTGKIVGNDPYVHDLPPQIVHESSIYALKGNALVLVRGRNPVPSF